MNKRKPVQVIQANTQSPHGLNLAQTEEFKCHEGFCFRWNQSLFCSKRDAFAEIYKILQSRASIKAFYLGFSF